MKKSKIAIIGGDMRQIFCARVLAESESDVVYFGIDTSCDTGDAVKAPSLAYAVSGASAVILPLPWTVDRENIKCPLSDCVINARYLFSICDPGSLILGGMLSDKAYGYANEYKLRIIDYYTREELSVLNAVPTSEGAVEIAMRELPITIHEMKAAVIGFGRVGQTLAKTLYSLGAETHVFARKPEAHAWAKVYGYIASGINELASSAPYFDCFFNTVPAPLLSDAVISRMREGVLVIDVASTPGADRASAEKHGIRLIDALSLPGKTAPVTAGKILARTIQNILVQENII